MQGSHTSEITGKPLGELAKDSNLQPRTPPKILRSCVYNTTTPGRPRGADLPECCISRDAVDKMTGRALKSGLQNQTRATQSPFQKSWLVKCPRRPQVQTATPYQQLPPRSGLVLAWLLGTRLRCRRKAGCLLGYINDHVLSIRGHAQRYFHKVSISSSGLAPY